MRQSEWINTELHGTGSETDDDPRRPECMSVSNETWYELWELPVSPTVSWGARC
jgi:hypothetical protein